ncbi:MAG: hypothetical protein AAF725_04680 [Acidobacteriota bacterium]
MKKKSLMTACLVAAALVWSAPIFAAPADLETGAELALAAGESQPAAQAPQAEVGHCETGLPEALPAFLGDVELAAFQADGDTAWGGGNNCVGTLGYFIAPACQACGVNRFSCEHACRDRGGVDYFSCGGSGIECHCNDGNYDSCGCGW